MIFPGSLEERGGEASLSAQTSPADSGGWEDSHSSQVSLETSGGAKTQRGAVFVAKSAKKKLVSRTRNCQLNNNNRAQCVFLHNCYHQRLRDVFDSFTSQMSISSPHFLFPPPASLWGSICPCVFVSSLHLRANIRHKPRLSPRCYCVSFTLLHLLPSSLWVNPWVWSLPAAELSSCDRSMTNACQGSSLLFKAKLHLKDHVLD